MPDGATHSPGSGEAAAGARPASPRPARGRRPARSPTRRRSPRLSEHLFMVLVAIVCGVGGALGAVGFRFLIRSFQDLFFGSAEVWRALASGDFTVHAAFRLAVGEALPAWRRLVAPAVGGLFVGPLVYFLAREAKGHGVPEVMEAVAIRGGTIRPRVVAVKALASAICIGSGGSVGREGPIVQIGSALASTVGQLLRVPARQLRTLVGCGAAAGIAATFNAPIAGALFAVEVILGDFAVPQFSPIVISSVVATVISRLFLGDFPAFEVPPYELVSPWELGAYMIVGLGAALVAVLFVRLLYGCEDLFERLALPEPARALAGGVLVGAIGMELPHVFGVGYGTINAALTASLPLGLLAVLLVAKLLATSITLGSGGSGGIFAPSLFLGAATGGLFGTVLHHAFPAATASAGAYALVTMGAVVAAATHAPITAILIIFELTHTITIIPPLMAACVVSTLLASFLQRDSIYTLKLRRRGLDPFAAPEPNVLKTLLVREVIDRNPETLPASASFSEVLDLVVQSDHDEFFVLDEKGELAGAISLAELRRWIFEEEHLRHVLIAADLLETDRPSVSEEDDLDTALQMLARSGVTEIAVVDPEHPRRLVGSVREKDIVEARNREVMRRDLAGWLLARPTLSGSGQRVELGGGYVVAEVKAPSRLVGRSLRELDLRAQSGVEVLLVRRPEGGAESIRLPTPDDRIGTDDILVVAGPESAVDRLAAR